MAGAGFLPALSLIRACDGAFGLSVPEIGHCAGSIGQLEHRKMIV